MLSALRFRPAFEQRLPHQATHVGWDPGGQLLVALEEQGRFTILDRTLDVVLSGESFGQVLSRGSIDASEERLAFAARASILVTDFDATKVTRHEHPPWRRGAGDVQFLPDGSLVTVVRDAEGGSLLQLRDPDSGLALAQHGLGGDADARYVITPVAHPGRCLVSGESGPGSGRTWLFDVGPELDLVAQTQPGDAGPLIPGGGLDAVRVRGDGVERFTLSSLTRVGGWSPRGGAGEPEAVLEGAIAPDLCFLGEAQILFREQNAAELSLLELESMQVVHRVVIDGVYGSIRRLVPEPHGSAIAVVFGDAARRIGLLVPPYGDVS